MPRYLGIDFGLTRVGLAISDPSGTIAQPLKAITFDNFKDLIEQIVAIIDEKGISHIVIGNPLHLSGENSEMSDVVKKFSENLSNSIPNIKLSFIDERFSSKEARRTISECGGKPSMSKGQVDAISAALILSIYLEKADG